MCGRTRTKGHYYANNGAVTWKTWRKRLKCSASWRRKWYVCSFKSDVVANAQQPAELAAAVDTEWKKSLEAFLEANEGAAPVRGASALEGAERRSMGHVNSLCAECVDLACSG